MLEEDICLNSVEAYDDMVGGPSLAPSEGRRRRMRMGVGQNRRKMMSKMERKTLMMMIVLLICVMIQSMDWMERKMI